MDQINNGKVVELPLPQRRVIELVPTEPKDERALVRKLTFGSSLFLLAVGVAKSDFRALVGGGLLAYAYMRLRSPRLKLISLDEDPEPESKLPVPKANSATVYIPAPPNVVYDQSRDLAKLGELWPEIQSVEIKSPTSARVFLHGMDKEGELTVITDQPGEFWGFRIDVDGKDYCNGLVAFDDAPGDTGTVVNCKLRSKTPGAEEIARMYAENLKASLVY